MLFPPPLKKNDHVGIVAIANKVSPKEIQPGVRLLEYWGLNPVIGKTIGLSHHQLAGTDQDRLEDLQQQLDNPDLKAIFMARGGYGTIRIVDQLDFTKFRISPKWIIGYSDITALHAHLQHLGYASLHAEMPAYFDQKSSASASSLKAALFKNIPDYKWEKHDFNRPGTAEGNVIGGNMSILYSLCGSRTAIQPHGKILFLEDTGEYLYHIDRMMQNFKRNGWFDNLSGMILGGFNKMKDNDIPFGQNAKEIIREAIEEYTFPIAFDFPAGHLNDNRALLFGGFAKLHVGENNCHLAYDRINWSKYHAK